MYPTQTDNIVAFAKGPAGAPGPINQGDIDALKGGVPADGDTLKKLYDLITGKAPIDGADLTNATTTTQAAGNNSASVATTAFVDDAVTTSAAAVMADVDDGLAQKLNSTAVDTDPAFAANSDEKVPSQKAVKSALDAIKSAWVAYNPAISASSGPITTPGACSGRYKLIGKTVHFVVDCLITTNGTGAGQIQIALPLVVAGLRPMFCGAELGTSGKSVQAYANVGALVMRVVFLDFTYPGADNARFNLSGTYETA